MIVCSNKNPRFETIGNAVVSLIVCFDLLSVRHGAVVISICVAKPAACRRFGSGARVPVYVPGRWRRWYPRQSSSCANPTKRNFLIRTAGADYNLFQKQKVFEEFHFVLRVALGRSKHFRN